MKLKCSRSILLASGTVMLSLLLSCERPAHTYQDDLTESESNSADPPSADIAFVADMAEEALYMIQVGNLAVAKAQEPTVKEFARKSVRAHTDAIDKLRSVNGDQKSVMPHMLSERNQKRYNQLDQQDRGKDFDLDYIDQVIKSLEGNVEKIEDKIEHGSDGTLNAWASEIRPILRQHLQEARHINQELRN